MRLPRRGLARLLAALALVACLPLAGAPAVAADDTVADTSYRLKTGDKVRVTVYGHEDLSGQFDVDGTGKLALPLVQGVNAAGLTAPELAAAIAAKLLNPDKPVVSVSGDGGFAMTAHVLSTAVQYQLPVAFVVMNNSLLGMVYDGQERRPVATELIVPWGPGSRGKSPAGSGQPGQGKVTRC